MTIKPFVGRYQAPHFVEQPKQQYNNQQQQLQPQPRQPRTYHNAVNEGDFNNILPLDYGTLLVQDLTYLWHFADPYGQGRGRGRGRGRGWGRGGYGNYQGGYGNYQGGYGHYQGGYGHYQGGPDNYQGGPGGYYQGQYGTIRYFR